MGIKTIVFDFGRVVGFFDHDLTSRRLAAHGYLPAEAYHNILFGRSLEDDYESGRISTDEFLRQVRDACRLTCSDEIIAAAWADIFWPNPEICALLPQLKPHYRLLLGSNTNELHARQFLRQFSDWLRPFDALVLSYEIGVRKPKRGFFEHCSRLAECAPAECLFIDDLPANVAGARACDWRGIVYTNFVDFCNELTALGIKGVGLVDGHSGGIMTKHQ
jgi:putative hydrolase of the HAD superfamily